MANPKVAIIGLRAIGGSLGLALRQAEANLTLVGYDGDMHVARKAQQRGAVERIEPSLGAAMRGAALVMIATPLAGVREALRAARELGPGSILTDTATLKLPVLRWAEEDLPTSIHFVGGNPIVPQRHAGIEAARPDLFQGRTYCLTPSPRTDPSALDFVTQLVRNLGAEPYFLDPAEHDGQMAALEHLPFLMAAALYQVASRSPAWRDMLRLVSDVFRHATELPPVEPDEYGELALSNQQNLTRWIELYIERLREIGDLLEHQDRELLTRLFSEAIAQRWQRESSEHRSADPVQGVAGVQNQAQPTTSLSRLLHSLRKNPDSSA